MVRCRCGHRVLAKEVLRTDLYERPSGREYVYVKYRCQRCKRMGETFVAESCWDWRIFEAARNELSESETELFSQRAPISSEDVIDLHQQLITIESLRQFATETAATENFSLSDKTEPAKKPAAPSSDGKSGIKKSAEPNPKKSPRSEDGNPRS
jgi:DNA-directed RNA polymerase subunit RPC12/RpoP